METFQVVEANGTHPTTGLYHQTSPVAVIDAVKANGMQLLHGAGDNVRGTRAKFVGRKFMTPEACLQATGENWAKGLDEIESMIAELQVSLPAPVSRRRRPKWLQDDGSEICLDRLRSGQDFWRDARRQTSTGQNTITIITDMATPSIVDSRDILWRGAAAVALTHLLEEAGYRVELIAASSVQNVYTSTTNPDCPHDCCHAITLKHPEQPVDLSTLTNWVSGWAYRTIWWMWKNCQGTPSSNYGRPMDLQNPKLKAALTSDDNAWVITGVWNRGDALTMARGFLQLLQGSAAA